MEVLVCEGRPHEEKKIPRWLSLMQQYNALVIFDKIGVDIFCQIICSEKEAKEMTKIAKKLCIAKQVL